MAIGRISSRSGMRNDQSEHQLIPREMMNGSNSVAHTDLMVNVILIHGSYGNPDENWFPWLKTELEKFGCKVFVPQFPTPENQSLDSWREVFDDYRACLKQDAVVVGHSLGPAFLLDVLENAKNPIKSAFFVAGFVSLLNNPNFDKVNKTFVEHQFNWNKIKNNCKNFFVFHSGNDPYVPFDKGKDLSNHLGAELNIVAKAGHFNKASGYETFPLLLEKIKNSIQTS
jgi:uncharacterized protein